MPAPAYWQRGGHAVHVTLAVSCKPARQIADAPHPAVEPPAVSGATRSADRLIGRRLRATTRTLGPSATVWAVRREVKPDSDTHHEARAEPSVPKSCGNFSPLPATPQATVLL